MKDENLRIIIESFINYKVDSYYRFLTIKLDLQQIKHRKIVLKISTKYIPQNKLELFY